LAQSGGLVRIDRMRDHVFPRIRSKPACHVESYNDDVGCYCSTGQQLKAASRERALLLFARQGWFHNGLGLMPNRFISAIDEHLVFASERTFPKRLSGLAR
jgi:hypothetical protein